MRNPLAECMQALGFLVVAAALFTVFAEFVSWLKDDYWPKYLVSACRAGCYSTDIPWKGLQRLVVWFVLQPLSLILFVIGAVIAWIGFVMEEKNVG